LSIIAIWTNAVEERVHGYPAQACSRRSQPTLRIENPTVCGRSGQLLEANRDWIRGLIDIYGTRSCTWSGLALDRAVCAAVQVFDLSPICTLALAGYAGRPISPVLAGEVDRVVADGVYQRRVLFVHLLGFITPTTARRISYTQSVRFERLHQQAYRNHGFELVDVPAGSVEERVELVDHYLRSWADDPVTGYPTPHRTLPCPPNAHTSA
jgi:AAA domain-containing protein